MPLLSGKKNVGKNIKTEMSAGKPRKQAIAIALSVERRGNKSAAKKPKSSPDFSKNPMGFFRGKPKQAKTPAGRKR